MSASENNKSELETHRFYTVIGAFVAAMLVLLWRAVDLQVLDSAFLQQQGDARQLRVVTIPAHRGMITDRNGEPLAISTPVESIWANPQELVAARERWPELARAVDMKPAELERLLLARKDREFVYLRRQVAPKLAKQVMDMDLPGVALQREYHRYYPTGEVFAHVVGFTNVDDTGLEGLELAYNDWLEGIPGRKRVIKDRLGRVVENVENITASRPGRDLRLSLDRRIQYLAYRELKAAVKRYQARSGSAVMLDARSGEILAMVNQPAYNPNNMADRGGGRTRNRAVTDVFEPGSTIKPFTVAAALESGRFHADTPIDTSPGFLRLGADTVEDEGNLGPIDVATVLQKSSNVGASKIALAMDESRLPDLLGRVGFGLPSGSGFPGEVDGTLHHRRHWQDIERATLAFGYGLSVTTLQLAEAYTVLAGDGVLRRASFLPHDGARPEGTRAMSAATARQVRGMLERVVEPGGTGTRAQVPGYQVAGKTGTARKVGARGYTEDRYVAVFAGMAPASDPRLVLVVMVNEPRGDRYYGGLVAAPVFSRVMSGALRLLDIAPDDLPSLGQHMASAEGAL